MKGSDTLRVGIWIRESMWTFDEEKSLVMVYRGLSVTGILGILRRASMWIGAKVSSITPAHDASGCLLFCPNLSALVLLFLINVPEVRDGILASSNHSTD